MSGTDDPESTIREIALGLFIVDCLLCDFDNIEEATPWARRIFDGLDTDPTWGNGRHQGDCTKQAHTCNRCLVEEYEDKARALAIEEGFTVPA